MTAEELHFVSHPPRAVPLAKLEDELIKLWTHPEQAEELQTHAIRACMSNLVVYSHSQDDVVDLERTLIEIVQRHPSRLIVLLERPDPGSLEAEALVSAHLDRFHQVFCEQITLRTGRAGLDSVPSLINSLLLEDLPTSFWWASSAPLPHAQRWFMEATRSARQLIYDSFSWREIRPAVVAVTQWLSSAVDGRSVADLAWRRLKPWRRVIAHALEPELIPDALSKVKRVYIEHGPHALPQAWLLTGWMAHLLGWELKSGMVSPGTEIEWSFRGREGDISIVCRRVGEQQEFALLKVELLWGDKQKMCIARFTADAAGHLLVTYEGVNLASRSIALPQRTVGMMVARQLSDLGRDPLFDRALAVSRQMADVLE